MFPLQGARGGSLVGGSSARHSGWPKKAIKRVVKIYGGLKTGILEGEIGEMEEKHYFKT